MACGGTSYMKRSDFSNDDMYAVYVRNQLEAGQTVVCCRTYEEVRVGDCGKVIRVSKHFTCSKSAYLTNTLYIYMCYLPLYYKVRCCMAYLTLNIMCCT